MFVFAACLELIGVALLGIPVVRLMKAARKVGTIARRSEGRYPEVLNAVKSVEIVDIQWPGKIEIMLVGLGVILCMLSAAIKIYGYSMH